jgi:hypothetical protein
MLLLLEEADGLASASAPRGALGAPRGALGELNPTLQLYPGVDSPRAVGAPRAAFGGGEALPWPLPPQRALAGAQFTSFTRTKVQILA